MLHLTKIATAFATLAYAQFLDEALLQLQEVATEAPVVPATSTEHLPMQNAVAVPSNAAKLLCYIIKNGNIFDYTPLTAADHYSVKSVDGTKTMYFNYCKFATWPSNSEGESMQTFAYLVDTITQQPETVYTSNSILLPHSDFHEPIAGESEPWLTITQKSNTPCPYAEEMFISFQTEVLCDATIVGLGNAKIVSADTAPDQDCNVKVCLAHESGCAVMSTQGFAKFLQDYPWTFAVVFILGGPVVALKGKPLFRWVVTSIAFVFGTLIMIIIFSLTTWMNSTGGLVGCILGSLAVGSLIGYFVYRMIWLGVGVLGVVGGYFLGTLLYSLALALLQWSSLWAMVLITIVCSVIGGYLAFKFPQSITVISTSGIGSYAFMRGWSYFFHGYPSESQIIEDLKNSITPQFTWVFYVYIGIFIVCWAGSLWWQTNRESDAVDVDEKEKDDFNKAE